MTQAATSGGHNAMTQTRPQRKVRKPWQLSLRKFVRHPVGVTALIVVILILVIAVLGMSKYHQAQAYDYNAILQSPSAKHPFGTDEFGRDIFTRILYGAHLSISVGLASVAVGATVGTLLGLIAGYYGGWRNAVIMRGTDVLLAFPGVVLAIGIMAILGSGTWNVILAVAIFTIPIFIRLVEGSVLAVRELPFVEAARTVGVSDARILWRYFLPNIFSTVMVYLTMRIGTAILIAASLGFLGLGVSPAEPEWGVMLNNAHDYIKSAPWTIYAPGLSILVTVLAFNLLGDALRDAFDPKLSA